MNCISMDNKRQKYKDHVVVSCLAVYNRVSGGFKENCTEYGSNMGLISCKLSVWILIGRDKYLSDSGLVLRCFPLDSLSALRGRGLDLVPFMTAYLFGRLVKMYIESVRGIGLGIGA